MTKRNPSLDLDVDSPERVASVLRQAANSYNDSAQELISSWQDSNAGKPWERIATILERAADSIDKALKRM